MLLLPFPTGAPHFTGPVLSWTDSRVQRWRLGEMFSERHCKHFSAQTNSCIAFPGLFVFQTHLLESGEDAVSSTVSSASFLTSLLTLHSYLCHKTTVVGERPSAKEKGRVMPRKSHHQVSPALLATGDTQHETRHPDTTASSYRTFLPCEAAGK